MERLKKTLYLTIHRGTKEIGGSCVELATKNTRILIDILADVLDSVGDTQMSHELRRFVDDRNVTVSDLAKESYSATLAFRHPWIMRTPARWAMGLINSREEFLTLFC